MKDFTQDRMSDDQVSGESGHVIQLTVVEAGKRIAGQKFRTYIDNLLKRVRIRHGQIEALERITATEISQLRHGLITQYRVETWREVEINLSATLTQQARSELRATLDHEPGTDELSSRLIQLIDEIVTEQQQDFIEDELPGLLEEAVDNLLRFDLDSPEFREVEEARSGFTMAP